MIRKTMYTLSLFFLCNSVCISKCESSYAEEQKISQLQTENTLLHAERAICSFTSYMRQLHERQNKPENEQEFLEKVEAAQEYSKKTGDYSLLQKVTALGYKKTWWDRHPFKGDLLVVGGITITTGTAIYLLIALS